MLTINHRTRLSSLLITFIFSCGCLHAQMGTLFNSSQKLSSSYVKHVYQDRLGFTWVSTENGLNRYDGYSFLLFNSEDGLEGDNVNCTVEGKDGRLYAGTTSGLYVKEKGRFHKLTDAATNEPSNGFITSLVLSPKGDVIYSTSGRGVGKVSDDGHIQNIITSEGDAQYCRQVLFDKNGVLWVLTENKGVLSYRYSKGKETKLVRKYTPAYDVNYGIMCCDDRNNIYIGSLTGGIQILNSKRESFVLYPTTADTYVSSMLACKDGNIYIGTNGNGLHIFNPLTGEITPSRLQSHQLDLGHTKVYSIYQDRYNNLWLGLMQKGVFMQPPHSATFSYLGKVQGSANLIGESCVLSVFRQRDGTLWIGSDQDGLYQFAGNQFHHLSHSNNNQIPSTVLTMTEDRNGRLWVGSYTEGCGWVDPVNGSYHRCSFSYGNAQAVFDLQTDYLGRIWVGTLGDGVKCYDIDKDILTEYKDTRQNTLCNNYIIQMCMSPDRKKIFIGTATGLCALDLASGSWTKVLGTNTLFAGISVNGLKCTATTLWVGLPKGLVAINLKTKEQKRYTSEDGLPDSHICSIEIDKKGTLWVSTPNGLCQITDPENLSNNPSSHISCYFASDGLHGNEFNSGTSYYDLVSGYMYFGGVNGVTYFKPENVKNDSKKFDIVITGLFVSGERVLSSMKSGSFVVCDDAVSVEDRFDFCHNDNTITISFSTRTYSGTDHVSYSYSINGEDWITLPTGTNRTTLSRLEPGDYHFRVIATDHGVKSEMKEFDIVIHNPWYFTPVARCIYLLIIVSFLVWLIYNQKLRTKQRLALQESIHMEQLNEQRIRFFINMSHEIRTPMTLIITPLLQLLKEDQDAHRLAKYDIIKRNAERILHLVNQIMDIRKIEKGQMSMQMCETDINTFVGDVVNTFDIIAKSKTINLSFASTANESVWIDPTQFDKVLMNILSNAFKYTPAGGNIEVRIKNVNVENRNCISISVFDSGENIPEEYIGHVFDRFYQAKSSNVNKNKTGTGVGLDLTRSLVLLHHGSIECRNLENGVVFEVIIPLGKDHLSENEIAKAHVSSESKSLIDELLPIKTEQQIKNDNVTTEVAEVLVANATGSKKPLVIIVEDDDEIRNYILSELSQTYRALAFTNGGDALPVILKEIPQIVISDIMMPVMDGTTLCSKVKSNVNTNHIPFIMLSAKSRDEDKLEGLELGADLYITKPFNMDILRRNIANLLSTRKLLENKYTGKEDHKEQIDNLELQSVDERLINRIMAVINTNLNNSDLNIDKICTEVGISRVHLHRKMKELTNQTPHDFIRNLRLKQAARLLERKGQSITEVMYHCGFNSATSFSTMFKKMYGMSPREYMKEHQK